MDLDKAQEQERAAELLKILHPKNSEWAFVMARTVNYGLIKTLLMRGAHPVTAIVKANQITEFAEGTTITGNELVIMAQHCDLKPAPHLDGLQPSDLAYKKDRSISEQKQAELDLYQPKRRRQSNYTPPKKKRRKK